jgi:protein MpaA
MSLFNPVQSDQPVYPHKLRRLYWPFLALAEVCREVVGTVAGSFEVEEKRYTIPRFVFHGPATTGRPIRLGLFALLHGDALAGALGLHRLLNALVDDPAPAAGYELAFYPLCNPTGFEDGTRHNRAGFDLSREFWPSSSQPEIKILQDELRAERYDGLIALQADDTRGSLGGYTLSGLLNKHLLAPALRAASQVLPRRDSGRTAGCAVKDGIDAGACPDSLSPPPEQQPHPFEVVFETPVAAPMTQQIEAISCALRAVLKEYRTFIAQGTNL